MQLTDQFVLLKDERSETSNELRWNHRSTYRLSIVSVLLFSVRFELWIRLLIESLLNLLSSVIRIAEGVHSGMNKFTLPYRWNSSRFFFCSSKRETCSISYRLTRSASCSSERRVSSSFLEHNGDLHSFASTHRGKCRKTILFPPRVYSRLSLVQNGGEREQKKEEEREKCHPSM